MSELRNEMHGRDEKALYLHTATKSTLAEMKKTGEGGFVHQKRNWAEKSKTHREKDACEQLKSKKLWPKYLRHWGRAPKFSLMRRSQKLASLATKKCCSRNCSWETRCRKQ